MLQHIADILDSAGDVAVEFFQIWRELCGQLRILQARIGVVDALQGFERVVVKDIAHIMRFLRVSPHFLAAEVDERIELLRGLRHEVHGQRVPLGLVFDLTERVDGVVKYILRAAEAAVGVGDLYAQTLVRIIGVAGARCGLLHFVGGLLEAVLDAVHGDVREVRHVIELLHGVGRHAGHGGEREQIVCIRGCFLRHGDQRLFRLDDGRRDGGKAAR